MRVSFRHRRQSWSLRHWALWSTLAFHAWTFSANAEAPFGKSESSPSRVHDPGSSPGKGDGVYGRLRGDMSYRLELGGLWDIGTETFRPLGAVQFSVYQTVGAYGTFSQRIAPHDPVERTLSLGLTLTPLFLLRWSTARESGLAFWDLMTDSIGIGAGVVLTQPRYGSFAEEPGFELGLLWGVPLFARANGLWLRFRGDLVTGRPPIDDQNPVEATLRMTLAWEGFFFAGLLGTD